MSVDKRKDGRVSLAEDIMFANRSDHPFCYYGAKTINYSPGGLCFQSRYEARPGDNLCVRMIGRHLQSFGSLEELTCIAEVRWCSQLSSPDTPAYQIGLHYHGDLTPPLFRP